MSTAKFQIYAPILTPHSATLRYEGEICVEGVSLLVEQIRSTFDYYQYDHVGLHLESPGGAAVGLDYLLRNIAKYQDSGKSLHVRSTFLCASAAALLLAFGSWGTRRVDRATVLLFHFARIGASVSGLTAQTANGYSRSLEQHDRNMIEKLVEHLSLQAGGISELLVLVRNRLDLLDSHWAWVDEQLSGVSQVKRHAGRPEWFKKLRIVSKEDGEISRSKTQYIKYLVEAFQRDAPIDLREAFALALIDVVDDVVVPERELAPVVIETLGRGEEANEDEKAIFANSRSDRDVHPRM